MPSLLVVVLPVGRVELGGLAFPATVGEHLRRGLDEIGGLLGLLHDAHPLVDAVLIVHAAGKFVLDLALEVLLDW